jgi:hypothetical protein
MDSKEHVSTRRVLALAVSIAAAALLVPVGVEAAAPELVRLQDGNGDSRAEVKDGEVQVGDGKGPVTVDGDTMGKPATLLKSGTCPATDSLAPGTVVTTIFHTGPSNNYPDTRLDIFPGDSETTTALMSLKVYAGTGSTGELNAIYSSDIGFKVTGNTAWDIVCNGVHTGTSTNGGLWSIFGYQS